MAVIWTSKQPWIRRPSGIVTPNHGSAQLAGLAAWFPVSQGETSVVRDPIIGYSGSPSSGTLLCVPTSLGGYALRWSAYGTITTNCPAAVYNVLTTYNATVSVWARATAWSNRPTWTFNGDDDILGIPYDSDSGNGPRIFWRDVGTSLINLNTGVPAADGAWHQFTFVTRASNDHRLYVDGVEVGASSATGSAGPCSNFDIMSWTAGGTGFSYNGDAFDWRIYNRALTTAEIWYAYDPRTRWELYQPIVRRVYFDLAGGGGTTITPTAGSVSLTGAACALGLAFGLTAGALTFTGGTPSVLVSQTITPTAGAVTITGAAPSAQFGYQIAPTAGAVTITGGTPDVGISYVITPQAGAITLTGAAPTVTASDGVVARPDAGSITFTGAAPTVLVPVTVVPTAGSVTFTGAAPSVLVGLRIEPTAGSVTVTGGTPTVGISYAITPSTGTVTVTGGTPDVGISYVFAMTAGAVILTGAAPTTSVVDGSLQPRRLPTQAASRTRTATPASRTRARIPASEN